jgi:hypothetical protein
MNSLVDLIEKFLVYRQERHGGDDSIGSRKSAEGRAEMAAVQRQQHNRIVVCGWLKHTT